MSHPDHRSLVYSPIVEVAQIFEKAFTGLGIQATRNEFEALSCFINEVYGTRNRSFHDVHHAILVGTGCTSWGQIAAIFHDCVYIQVDRSRHSELRKLFGVFNPGEKLGLYIPSEDVLKRDPWRVALTQLFGLKSGSRIDPYSGINEFLSAWVCIQKLRDKLDDEILLKIVACIEATIPFRGLREVVSAAEELALSLRSASFTLGVSFSDETIDQIVKESVRIANNDVEGFGLEEPEVFIYNSWALLYEGNPALQNSFYTISKYRQPLQKLDQFLSGLNAKRIFREYKGYPSVEAIQKLHEGSERNLRVAREYIRAKILDTAILEAFARISGGDCPLELFTGPKPKSREEKTARIEEFLNWRFGPAEMHKKDERVVRLLNEGRAFRSRFDVKTALFAAYIYMSLSTTEFEQAYAGANEFLKDELNAEHFLNAIPERLVVHIGAVLAQVAWTRESQIKAYLEARSKKKAA